jgi:hypothetical protein
VQTISAFDVVDRAIAIYQVIVHNVGGQLFKLYSVCLARNRKPAVNICESLSSDAGGIFDRKNSIFGGERLPMTNTLCVLVVDAKGFGSALSNAFEFLLFCLLSH